MRKKILLKILIFCMLLFGILNFLGLLFDPFLTSATGYNYYKYQNEQHNSIQVLLLGSSFLYCGFSPMEAYGQNGFTSYVIGGPEQSMASTAQNLEQALETQSPKVVVIEIKSLAFGAAQKPSNVMTEAPPSDSFYTNLNYALKGESVSAAPKDLFRFFTYHNRWKSLTKEDFKGAYAYMKNTEQIDPLKGYVLLNTIGAEIRVFKNSVNSIDMHFNENMLYLDKIKEICDQKGIQLLFVVMPSTNVNYFDSYSAAVQAHYQNKVPIINLNNYVTEMGLDYMEDMYDGGHTNDMGALKCTRFLSDYLEQFQLIDQRKNPLFQQWAQNYERYIETYF